MRLNSGRVSEGLDSVFNAQLTGKQYRCKFIDNPLKKSSLKAEAREKTQRRQRIMGLNHFPLTRLASDRCRMDGHPSGEYPFNHL